MHNVCQLNISHHELNYTEKSQLHGTVPDFNANTPDDILTVTSIFHTVIASNSSEGPTTAPGKVEVKSSDYANYFILSVKKVQSNIVPFNQNHQKSSHSPLESFFLLVGNNGPGLNTLWVDFMRSQTKSAFQQLIDKANTVCIFYNDNNFNAQNLPQFSPGAQFEVSKYYYINQSVAHAIDNPFIIHFLLSAISQSKPY